MTEIWDKIKIPWYTHKLMHRKRVTCELHDSYFRLMTTKHAIPKIEWGIELLYNSVWTGSQWVGDQTSWREDVLRKATTRQKGPSEPRLRVGDQMCWRQDVVEKATTRQKGPLEPPIELGTRQVREKMLEWEHVPERLGPQAPSWAVWENENVTRRCPEGLGRSMCCSLCSVSNSLSHVNLTIKWEVYILLKTSRSSICITRVCMYVCMYVLCVCIVNHGQGYTTSSQSCCTPFSLFFSIHVLWD